MAAPYRDGAQKEGWNDPPTFQYSAGTTSSPGRTLLNKRVGHQLHAASSPVDAAAVDGTGVLLSPKIGAPHLPPVQILPPKSSTSVNPPVPVLMHSPPIDQADLPPSFALAGRDPQKSESMHELLLRLELDSADCLRKYSKKVLHETLDSLQDCIQGRPREDVQSRLGLLDDQWRDGKLSEKAKVKVGCLATAVKNSDLKQADSLHLALMVDHISEVSQWMVGIKRIINELKLAEKQPAVTRVISQADTDKASTPQFFTPSESSATSEGLAQTVDTASTGGASPSQQTSVESDVVQS